MEPRNRRWVLTLTSIASLMVALDTLVVSTALTTIRLELGASVEELEWTVNAYNLSLAVLLLPAAALGDRFGRRRLFAVGLALFTAASAACALSPDVGCLIAARAAQGVGAALVLSLSLSLVSAAYPPERRGSAIGILEGVTGLAVLGGPTLGGAVAEGLSWEWIFWINVPIGALALSLVLARIEGSTPTRRAALDVPGLVLVGAGALGLVWGLVRGNEAGWSSLEVSGALALGLGLIGAFVAWERRAAEPMLPMRLFRRRGFSAGNAAVFCLFASIFGGVFFFAQFLQVGLGYDALGAGLRLLPWTASLFLVAPVAGALADRLGDRPLLFGGLALQASGMGWVALIAEPGMAYGELVVPLIVAGLGGSMAIPPAASAVVRAVPAESVGTAAGANSMLRELGGVFGIAAAVAVFAAAGGYASATTFHRRVRSRDRALGGAGAGGGAGVAGAAGAPPGSREQRAGRGCELEIRKSRRGAKMTATANRTSISQVGTVFVPVAEQDRALEFYLDKLGFEKRADFPYGEGSRWIEVAPPGSAMAIALVPPSEGEPAGGEQAHCALTTEDIEADHATLLARGVDADAEIARVGKRRPGLVSIGATVGDPVPP